MPIIPCFKNWSEFIEKFPKVKPIKDTEAPKYEELSEFTPTGRKRVNHRGGGKKRVLKAASKKEEIKEEPVKATTQIVPELRKSNDNGR